MIGLSLSLCILDILDGLVEEKDVEKIITNTAARNEADWDKVLEQYQRGYWSRDPRRAFEIVLRLIADGKIVQPRVLDPNYRHSIAEGRWIKDGEIVGVL